MLGIRAAYVALFAGAAVVSCYGAYRTTEVVDRDTRRGLFAAFLLSGVWALTTAVRLATDLYQFYAALRIIGLIVGLASIGAWLYFSSAYSGLEYHKNTAVRRAAVGFYLIASVIKLTNPVYHLYFTPELSTVPFPHLSFSPGPTYWLVAGIAYITVGVGLFWLFDAVTDPPTTDWRLLTVLALTGLPGILDVLITLEMVPSVVVKVSYAPIGISIFALGTFAFTDDTLRPVSKFWRRQVLTQLNEAIIIVDSDHRLRYISQSATETFDELNAGSGELFSEVAPSLCEQTYNENPVFKQKQNDEDRYYRVINVELSDDRISTHRAFVYTEVTESERTKQDLQRKSRVMDKAPIGITISEQVDGKTSLAYTNQRFREVTKYGREALFREDLKLKSLEVIEDAATGGTPETITLQEQRKDETAFWNQITVAPIVGADNSISEYVAFHRNITNHKENRRQLKQYKSAVEGSPDWIVAVDSTGDVIFANQSFCQAHGLDSEMVRGTHATDYFDSATGQIENGIQQALAGNSITFEHHTQPDTAGQPHLVENTVSPLRNEDNEINGAVLVVEDLSDLKQREQQLEVLDRVLRHNLSNKMNVITGYAEATQQRIDDPEILELIEKIIQTSTSLIDLVDKERDVTRALTNQTSNKIIDLSSVTESSVSSLKREFSAAEITIDLPAQPVQIAGKPLGRAIEELLQNAVLHSDQSTPEVSVRVWTEGDTALLAVADNGPGIPQEDQCVVSGTEEIQPLLHGRGLGLWLVRIVVNQAGGTLRFDTNEPRGSVVTMEFPLFDETVDATHERNKFNQ